MSKCSSNCYCQDNCHSDKIKESDIIKIINRINKICKNCKPCQVLSTCVVPSIQATFLTDQTWFDNTTMTWNANITWARGNGDGVIVIGQKLPSSVPLVSPKNNTTYTPDYEFGKGDEIGLGQYVVYNGSGSNATITGLQSNALYNFVIFEYNSSEFCYTKPGSSIPVVTPPSPM